MPVSEKSGAGPRPARVPPDPLFVTAPHRRVLGDAVLVGALTTAAKLAGAAKVMATARYFGAGDVLDAFLIAFLLPSFVSDVVAGSFTPTLVPVLVRAQSTEGPRAAQRLARLALGFSGGLMLAAALALALMGRWLLPLAGSSFSSEKLHLSYLLFLGLIVWLPMSACIATWRAVLNANRRFALAAIAPLASPVLLIVFLFAFAERWGVAILCGGTVAGVALECLVLALAVRRLGYPVTPLPGAWKAPELKTLRDQYFPLAAGVVVSSMGIVVDQSVAGRLGPGQVSALSRQDGPQPPDAAPIEGRTILLLAVAVSVVAVPNRAPGRVDLEKGVRHGKTAAHDRIVRAAKAEADELEKIDADLLVGRQRSPWLAILDFHVAVKRRGIRQNIRRSDPDVISLDGEALGQSRTADARPGFDARIPEVGEGEGKGSCRRVEERGAGDQRRDADGQGEDVDSGILFPAVL